MRLPEYTPLAGPQPDLPATGPGLQAAYLAYPADRPKSVSHPPGRGGRVTALTQTTIPPTPLADNPAWQAINHDLNVEVSFELAHFSEFTARVSAVMASPNLPDLFYLDNNSIMGLGGIAPFLGEHYADLTPYLADAQARTYPHLAAFPTSTWTQMVFDEAIRAVPVVRPAFNWSWFVNQTKLDAIGAGPPTNADDFKRILKALTRPQQDQYGIAATAPAYGLQFSGKGDAPQLAMFGVPNNWVNEGGAFTKDIETEQFRQALGFVRDLYAAGVFYPDPTLNIETVKANFISGKSAVITTGWIVYGPILWEALARQTPPARVRALRPFSHDGSVPIWHAFQGVNGLTAIKKGPPDRIHELLGILNYLAAPFGTQESLLLEYGVQAADFNFDMRGNPVLTAKGRADTSASWRYLAQHEQVLYYPGDPDFVRAAYADQQAMAPYLVADPTVGLYSATEASTGPLLVKGFLDGLGDLVTGRSPLGALDQLLADWRTSGGDLMRREFEAAYQQAHTRF